MKKLIFLLMLFKGCVAFGQTEPANDNYWQADTAEYRKMLDDAVKIIEWYDGSSVLSVRPISYLYDTIPCFMLCSDTSFTFDTLSRLPKVIRLIRYTNKEIFWLHGYEVRQPKDFYTVPNADGIPVQMPFMTHKEYIGYDKHPLPKNVVVWMAK